MPGTKLTDYDAEYQSRTDEQLLLLWVDRSELLPEAQASLQSEISKRGLTKQATEAKSKVNDDGFTQLDDGHKEPDGKLAPAVAAWGPSIAWYWLRELRLRYRTKNGIPIEARVESTKLTRPVQGRGGGGRRAELCYSYDCQGSRTGRTVRDFMVGDKIGRSLAFGHKPGDTITVLVSSTDPDCSYFPSGFGWVQPLLFGVFFAIIALFLLAGVVIEIFTVANR